MVPLLFQRHKRNILGGRRLFLRKGRFSAAGNVSRNRRVIAYAQGVITYIYAAIAKESGSPFLGCRAFQREVVSDLLFKAYKRLVGEDIRASFWSKVVARHQYWKLSMRR